MKRLLLFLLIASQYFFSCKNQDKAKESKQNESEILADTIPQLLKNEKKVNICNNNEHIKAGVLGNFVAEHSDFYENKELIFFSKNTIEAFFQPTNLKCFNYSKSRSFRMLKLKYDKDFVNEIYDFIKNVADRKIGQENQEYHDFFKRGVSVQMLKKKGVLILIFFDPFITPKNVKTMRKYLLSSKNKYDLAFITVGLGHVEDF